MNGDSASNQNPSYSLFEAMPLLGLLLEKKTMALCNHEILGKSDAVWRHVTVYDAAEPFHVLHMDPMSDDLVSNQIPSPYLSSHSKPCHIFACSWQKHWHFATKKSWAKVMLFGDM
jgi:hypothetical protein